LIGAYSINSSIFDLYVMILFGVVGYLTRKFGYEIAPLVLAYVLGPQLELALRQSLLMSKGSFTIFFTRPISGVTMGIAFLLLLSNLLPYFKKHREKYEEFKE
jgi:putative tricarboxylic transport membrane protein